jgi:hypothetical protein
VTSPSRTASGAPPPGQNGRISVSQGVPVQSRWPDGWRLLLLTVCRPLTSLLGWASSSWDTSSTHIRWERTGVSTSLHLPPPPSTPAAAC